MAGRTRRPHRAHSRYLCKLHDWAHSQSYAAVFQLYAISGRAHFHHRPKQLHAVHRGWAHSQAFGGNVSAFNANTTSQASTRFAQLVLPHGYCWYPPKIWKKNICHGPPPALKYVSLLCCFRCSTGCYGGKKREIYRESKVRDHQTFMLHLRPSQPPVPSHVSPIALAALFAALVNAQVLLLLLLPSPYLFVGRVRSVIINPFTATGYFDIPPPRWPTFLVTLFPILKEGMGLSL